MSERPALEIASRLEALIPIAGGLAAEALRQQHAEIERLKAQLDHTTHAHRPDCCGPQIDTHCTGCTMTDLTALEIAGNLETFGQGWIDAVDMHHAEIGRMNAERETIISNFLKRTGQYVTNDASREAAIAAAVAAEREACAVVCIAQADRLEGPSDACGIALVCAGMIRARTKP